ncbi:hypothetical protein KJ848_03645 [Patescibacteria group bacterium]|nr:hypothetical protein [Patescibacteria group bacterium]MBU2159247.1 hypothetical protein [Patescibacteria group bacterium]
MKVVALVLGLVLLALIVLFALMPEKVVAPEPVAESSMDIETYVRTSLSELSEEKEQLGGTFYITHIETENGVGVVEYEDGHNAYTADFTYQITEEGEPQVLTFEIRY